MNSSSTRLLRDPVRSKLISAISCSALLILLCACEKANAEQPAPQPSNVWQYSVPLERGTERRAYLWIPPQCRHLRGVLLGLQNMLERPMFEDPEIRAAVASSDMAIVWISPGAWPGKLDVPEQPSLKFSPTDDAIAGVQRVLADLAHESGYSEIKFAPLLVTGHSAASPFVWGMAATEPNRVFAALPYKGYNVGVIPAGVPTLQVEQEWAEWGKTWGEVWHKELTDLADMRKKDPAALLGGFADLGSGHFDWHHDSAHVIALFIRKAAQYRLPAEASEAAPVTLKPISPKSGVLVDPNVLGTAQFAAVPYEEWKGDPGDAFWYFDREMAEAVDSYMRVQLNKLPQAIDFAVNGHRAPLVDNGFAVIKPEFLPDGITFRVHAESLTASPSATLYPNATLGHATTSITYRVGSGALRQTGPDTFQVVARSGGLLRQGQPWEPWILAYQPGDDQYRSADKPAHILIDVRNTQGASQTITFPRVPDVRQEQHQIHISATASSGLPVQLYVEFGPAVIEGNTLHLLPIPPRSRYPVRVIVSAFQWGRVGPKPIKTTGPQTQEFFIRP